MAASQYTKSIKAEGNLQAVIASQTKQVVSKIGTVPCEGRTAFRVDVFLGKVVGAAVKVGVQQSNSYNNWQDTKEGTAAASTNTAITAQTANLFTAASHGLILGDAVVFNGTALPAGINGNIAYRVQSVPSANTFTVAEWVEQIIPTVTSIGTTATVTKLQCVSVTFLDTVSADQAFLPLCNTIRGYVTTPAASTCQVVDVIINPGI